MSITTYTLGETSTSVVIIPSAEASIEYINPGNPTPRKRPACRFINTALFHQPKTPAIGTSLDILERESEQLEPLELSRSTVIEATLAALERQPDRPHSDISEPTESEDAFMPKVILQQRPIHGPTRPIGVVLVESRLRQIDIPNNPEKESGPNFYYHPDLNEWRPFPTEVEDDGEDCGGPQNERRHKKLRRIGNLLVLKIKDMGSHTIHPIDKKNISLPIAGSKRGAIESLFCD